MKSPPNLTPRLPSRRRLTRNVLDVYHAALPSEHCDGLDWYVRAHSIARCLAVVMRRDVDAAAALLAALSPLNRWQDNVSDAFAIARSALHRPRVTERNRQKAVAILAGAHPAEILSGTKVIAFWRGIADPTASDRIPIDRHLYRAAVGQRPEYPMPRSTAEYRMIESAYQAAAASLPRRHGATPLGVGSVVWLVMRRLTAAQHGLLLLTAPLHLPRELASRPRRGDGRDPRGYVRVYLGKGHPYANSGGWQWRHRLHAMEALGRKLATNEHTHHRRRTTIYPEGQGIPIDKILALGERDDSIENLAVADASYHGRYHASRLVMARNVDGTFRELIGEKIDGPESTPRIGAVVGPAAIEIIEAQEFERAKRKHKRRKRTERALAKIAV